VRSAPLRTSEAFVRCAALKAAAPSTQPFASLCFELYDPPRRRPRHRRLTNA